MQWNFSGILTLFLKGTVSCHLSGTPVGLKMPLLKSMEIKSNAEVSFTQRFLVHWIQALSSTAQDDKMEKYWKFKKKFGCKIFKKCSKSYLNTFSGKIHFLFCFHFIWNVIASESSDVFCLSTSYDQENSKTTMMVPL